MKNAMQLKALIKNISKSKNISAQIVMQNYMLERLLERISVSRYQPNFILKGGFLIAAMVGLDTRATMDMDATLKGMTVNRETIRQMFEELCKISLNDDITFSVKHVEDIRERDDYPGLRVALEANYPPLAVPLKVDITTGDQITPREIVFEYKLMFEPMTSISVLAYNLETVVAEKLETIISRGDQNTRPRDYYDIFIIHKLQWRNIKPATLRSALIATATKRSSISIVKRYNDILVTISNSAVMKKRWLDYQSDFDYAHDILFLDICTMVREILDDLNLQLI